MIIRRYFRDMEPDALGRRRFALFWEDPDNCWIPEPSKLDGEPVGHRRAQEFHTRPGDQDTLAADRGDIIIDTPVDPYDHS